MNSIKRKVLYNRPGGTASENSVMVRVTLPPDFVTKLGITPEEREVDISLSEDGTEIIIRKA